MNAEGNCPGGDEQPDVRWFTLRKERRTSTSMRKRDRRKAMTATHFRISETFFQYDQFTQQILLTAALNKAMRLELRLQPGTRQVWSLSPRGLYSRGGG